MTREEIRRAVGPSRQAVSEYERGKRKPDVSTLQALGKALGATLAQLLYEPDPDLRIEHGPLHFYREAW